MSANPSSGIGAHRLVVGAHYGAGGFLMQRVTAIVIAVFAIVLVLRVLFADAGYVGWASIFVPLWMKVFALIALFALLYHAWIGVRDIWMDYVKPVWVRVTLQTLTVLWLVGCAVWSVQILWSV